MSIRFRLLLSFTSVVIVSVILFMATAYLLSVAVTGDFRSISSFYRIHYSLNPLSEEEESIFLDLKYLAKHDPAKLKDVSLLEKYDNQLKMVQANLIVREENEIIYASPSLLQTDLSKLLPKYDMNNISIRNTMNLGSRFYSYAKFDFYYSEYTTDKGSIYVTKERSPFAEIVRKLLPSLIGVFLAILLLTSLLLYRYVTRKIVKPLDELRRSAEHIKDGDLTFQLQSKSKDEVGQLVMSFENMRQKLLESVQLQLHYEDNRKQLLSNISHDLRTPITTIKGYAEGIRDGVTNTKEKLDRYVNAIHVRSTDLERLVDELLYYSKLDMNKEPYSFQEIELHAFLRYSLKEMSIELDQNKIQVTWRNETDELAYVMADTEKLKRVIVNLVDNCLKYMTGQPKKIEIGFSSRSEDCLVWITDNGPGIHPDSLPHIFERFYREEPSRSRDAGGSGLGLAIAKHIIEGHGGQIWAESSHGHGTTIFFVLKKFVDHR
ncbi:HAMP domain-containing histidine kinase [Paenibacillus sp. GSMTC-2017]|uniref:sensor histidine kinase n=1 Tax=Paenibacillus sp. GSMTC-2017 TaxID=2794350 RepID=UPI0018D7605B|nr:HAMP domain-containing sensor histidine kinase [Paenibacillus sp. GSMTC-2017]MBH5317359.1 HAMP domain-containing histidine kinase [Paenibacillus sp. GSMTC-2017]